MQRILDKTDKIEVDTKIHYGQQFDGNLDSLMENNEAWAEGQESGFFSELATQQKPKIVWFGNKIDRIVLRRTTDGFLRVNLSLIMCPYSWLV